MQHCHRCQPWIVCRGDMLGSKSGSKSMCRYHRFCRCFRVCLEQPHCLGRSFPRDNFDTNPTLMLPCMFLVCRDHNWYHNIRGRICSHQCWWSQVKKWNGRGNQGKPAHLQALLCIHHKEYNHLCCRLPGLWWMIPPNKAHMLDCPPLLCNNQSCMACTSHQPVQTQDHIDI